MVTAKCTRCLGSATGKTFDEASAAINHAVGISRSIPCGDNYGCVISEDSEGYQKVEGKSTDKLVFDESKYTTAKKSKK